MSPLQQLVARQFSVPVKNMATYEQRSIWLGAGLLSAFPILHSANSISKHLIGRPASAVSIPKCGEVKVMFRNLSFCESTLNTRPLGFPDTASGSDHATDKKLCASLSIVHSGQPGGRQLVVWGSHRKGLNAERIESGAVLGAVASSRR